MSSRQEVVMFGGRDADANALSDTWVYSSGCWSRAAPTKSPTGRDYVAMAYDPVHDIVLLYGGRGDAGFVSDTWAWDGTSWSQVATTGPEMFGGPVAGYDPVSKQVLLFGIVSGGTAETWTWDGKAWVRLSPAHSPDARQSPALALDSTRGELILFGGVDASGPLDDTWAWTGADWVLLESLTNPPGRFRAAMGSWSAGGLVILWSGEGAEPLSDAWKWDGNKWSQVPSPGIRLDAAAVDTGSRVLFFGGEGTSGLFGDFETFDGQSWSSVT